MTAPTDRAALESVIAAASTVINHWRSPPGRAISNLSIPEIEILTAAAQAHLDTLPRTKMVEHYRVEGWHPLSGPWVACYPNKETAKITVESYRKSGAHSCVKLTGPHVQEVPA